MVAQRLVVKGRDHELPRAALDDLSGLVLVEDDVAGGVVAVVHPAWRRRGVEMQQVPAIKLDHVRPGFELDLLLRVTEGFHPRTHTPDPWHSSRPVGLGELPR